MEGRSFQSLKIGRGCMALDPLKSWVVLPNHLFATPLTFSIAVCKFQDHFQPRVHRFEVGMKLEVIHPSKPSVICPATVIKSLGPYYFLVSTDFIQELPSVTFCCHSDSNGIFPAGWSYKNGIDLTVPSSRSINI